MSRPPRAAAAGTEAREPTPKPGFGEAPPVRPAPPAHPAYSRRRSRLRTDHPATAPRGASPGPHSALSFNRPGPRNRIPRRGNNGPAATDVIKVPEALSRPAASGPSENRRNGEGPTTRPDPRRRHPSPFATLIATGRPAGSRVRARHPRSLAQQDRGVELQPQPAPSAHSQISTPILQPSIGWDLVANLRQGNVSSVVALSQCFREVSALIPGTAIRAGVAATRAYLPRCARRPGRPTPPGGNTRRPDRPII